MTNSKKDYNKYLRSDYWQDIRKQVYERDNYKCRLCNSDEKICVHHRVYDNLWNEDLNDLITLCQRCHSGFHKKNPKTSYSYYNNYIEFLKALEEKENKYNQFKEFVLNNIDKFKDIIDVLDNYNFIKYNEFKKYTYKICPKTFKKSDFTYFCLEYFNLVYVCSIKTSIKEQYNFPKRIGFNYFIVIRNGLYKQHKDEMTIINCVYNFEFLI